MQPSPDDYQNDGALQNRFQKVLRSLVLYFQARHLLFGIEFKEAFGYFSKQVVLALIALVFLVFVYALLLAGAIIVIDHFTRVPWWFVCLLLAPGHLVIGYLCLRLAKRPPEDPLFKESINELAKDREWLSNPTKPWW